MRLLAAITFVLWGATIGAAKASPTGVVNGVLPLSAVASSLVLAVWVMA